LPNRHSGVDCQPKQEKEILNYRALRRLVSLEVQFADVSPIPQVARVFGELGTHRCVIEASTVRLTSVAI
jgi:hypothetical protein